MKKNLAILAASLLLTSTAVTTSYAEDVIIQSNQLPAKATQYIKKHFSGKEIALTSKDNGIMDGDYKVVFADGCKVEFSSKGDWEKVDCEKGCVPVSVIPAKIQKYVSANFNGSCVSEISYENSVFRSEYKVELQNNIDLKFDKKYNFKGLDD